MLAVVAAAETQRRVLFRPWTAVARLQAHSHSPCWHLQRTAQQAMTIAGKGLLCLGAGGAAEEEEAWVWELVACDLMDFMIVELVISASIEQCRTIPQATDWETHFI